MIRRLAPLALLAAAGCATPSVLLLPDEAGGQGAVAVLESRGRSQEIVLAQGNSRARLGSTRIAPRPVKTSSKERRLLDELPAAPVTFIMYYDEGTTRIIPTSRPQFDALLAEVARRPGVEVQISGHTDRKGQDDDNDALSERRARAVLGELAEAGIPLDQLIAVGRGERDPRVPTEDGVEEIANRRVEVIVR